jgi:hypothetical protein
VNGTGDFTPIQANAAGILKIGGSVTLDTGANTIGTVAVSGITNTVGVYNLDSTGQYRSTFPVSGSVAVSGVTGSIGATILNGEGIARDTWGATQEGTWNVGTVTTVTGVTNTVATAVIDSSGIQYSGTNPLPTTDGFALPLYDYMSLTETQTTDTYVYKRGGAGGTTVGTVTIVYVDDTRLTLSTITRT